jgi:alpha-tubulin suppressor-like RCC1 family protein
LALIAFSAAIFLPSSPNPASAEGDIVAVSAGGQHTCAVTSDGGVRCWGLNTDGQLGNGTTDNSSSPVDVTGFSNAINVSAGLFHTCALTGSGGVKCWGRNSSGQLGDETTTKRLTPVDVSGLTSGVTTVQAGSFHTCARTTTGGVKCWGSNVQGQLGNFNAGDTTTSPVDVCAGGMFPCISNLTNVGIIAVGGNHTCVSANDVLCWGQNDHGQLATGDMVDYDTPVAVPIADFDDIAAGIQHTCSIRSSGALWCAGLNAEGQLGDGTRMSSSTWQHVMNGIHSVSPGGEHTCALDDNEGAVLCWGGNAFGQVGDGSPTDRLTPIGLQALTSGVTAIDAGAHHTCAITGGEVKCWGRNTSGQLGDGTTNDSNLPIGIVAKPTSTPTLMVTDTPQPAATDTPTPTDAPSISTDTPQPAATNTPASPPAGLIGDVDGSGSVNAIDAALILQFVAGLLDSLPCPQNADTNGDGNVNSIDAALILQFSAGLIGSLPP